MTENAKLSARLHGFVMRLFRPRIQNAITENAKELAALGRRIEASQREVERVVLVAMAEGEWGWEIYGSGCETPDEMIAAVKEQGDYIDDPVIRVARVSILD